MGNTREPAALKRYADQDFLERTTGFEPATLTLAKKVVVSVRRVRSCPLTWSPVRRFVRPARPVRLFRIPVYHCACPTKSITDTEAERSDSGAARIAVNHDHGATGLQTRIYHVTATMS